MALDQYAPVVGNHDLSRFSHDLAVQEACALTYTSLQHLHQESRCVRFQCLYEISSRRRKHYLKDHEHQFLNESGVMNCCLTANPITQMIRSMTRKMNSLSF